MKIIDNWFYKKWTEARARWNNNQEATEYSNIKVSSRGLNTVASSKRLESRGMQFTVYQANGGHILEYNSYDPNTDRHTGSLHIIPTDADMGQAIAHAITLELLKK